MNDAEVVTRVVAILTETTEWVREENDGADSDDSDDSLALVGELIADLFPKGLSISSDATPQQVANALSAEIQGSLNRTIGAFASAFHQLAVEHDRHDPEVTSAQVLQELALRAQQL